MEPVPILYDDECLLAVDKPTGILVHRTKLSEDKHFLLQTLRDQLGYMLYTIHRLDRATSGVLLFAKNPETAHSMHEQFRLQQVEKTYLAMVRGWLQDEGTIDYALSDAETGKLIPQSATTRYRCLDRSEIDAAIGLRYSTARFSLAAVYPASGRRHQIRKHLAHLRHPIIGDKKHGDVKQNNYFRRHFDLHRMFLHALELSFVHPATAEKHIIRSSPDAVFIKGLEITGLKLGRSFL